MERDELRTTLVNHLETLRRNTAGRIHGGAENQVQKTI